MADGELTEFEEQALGALNEIVSELQIVSAQLQNIIAVNGWDEVQREDA